MNRIEQKPERLFRKSVCRHCTTTILLEDGIWRHKNGMLFCEVPDGVEPQSNYAQPPPDGCLCMRWEVEYPYEFSV